jgi:hypothetical protein
VLPSEKTLIVFTLVVPAMSVPKIVAILAFPAPGVVELPPHPQINIRMQVHARRFSKYFMGFID